MGHSMIYNEVRRLGQDTYAACAPAKLNITLAIGEKESNGFHNISSTMQTVSLYDHIILKRVTRGMEGIEGPEIENNLVAKAVAELSAETRETLYCRIHISKSIPVAAGMGGGSSDAAAVLRIANSAFGLQFDIETLQNIASRIGNDVAFLVRGGRASVDGSMTHTIRQLPVPDLYYVIARPHKRLSTKEMYELHDKTSKDFTELAYGLCPDTGKLLDKLGNSGAVEMGVTGKGPTVFAGYESLRDCKRAAGTLEWLNGDVFVETSTETLDHR